MMPSRELSSERGAQEVTVESNGILSCYRKCDRLVNNKQQRGLSWGSTVYWLCGEDTSVLKALFFADLLPKKKHLPHTKEQLCRERWHPRRLEPKGP